MPAFVLRDAKREDRHAHARRLVEINRAQQDIEKMPMFCAACEGRFNVHETPVADSVIRPVAAGRWKDVSYDEHLLPFCVGVSYRALQHFLETGEPDAASQLRDYLVRGIGRWRSVLLSREPHPGPFRQYFIPTEELLRRWPPSARRASVGALFDALIGWRVRRIGRGVFVLTFFPKCLVIGEVATHHTAIWSEWRVSTRGGCLGVEAPKKLPLELQGIVEPMAAEAVESFASMSKRQWKKLDQVWQD